MSTVKNLKVELNTLKLFKKSLFNRLNGYYNKNGLERDLELYQSAVENKNFDLCNIFRVIIEEKQVIR